MVVSDDSLEWSRKDDELTMSAPFGTLAGAIRAADYPGKDFALGARVHHYKIQSMIGQGGMGSVFAAEHIYLKQKVALKTLKPSMGRSPEIAERFLREAQALAILIGPNVLRVQDASIFEGLPYVVTELVEGTTLQAHLEQHGTLTVHQTFDLLEQLGDVLIRQERYGILHRDIKPSNIFIRNDGTYCLIDYGLVGFTPDGPAKNLGGDYSTQMGSVMGTPAYMSPEQATDSSQADNRSDLFCLGATAWQCLTGRPPRSGIPVVDLLQQIRQKPIPSVTEIRPDVTNAFARILNSLTAMIPADRYATAAGFMAELEGYRYGRRRPYGATNGSAFVAIPFSQSFDNLFEFLQDTCGEAKLAARRVDRVSAMKGIWNEIDKEIRMAKVVIAVFTRESFRRYPNPNVLTEAAHAKAFDKPLIILTTDRAERLPFDWRHLPIIRYRNTAKGRICLREELIPRLREQNR